MATEKEKEWLGKQPDRKGNPPPNNSQSETGEFVDELAEIKRKAMKESMKIEVAGKAFGVDGAHTPQEPMQTTIVTKAMDTYDKTISRLEDRIATAERNAESARTERDEAKTALYEKQKTDLQQIATEVAESLKQAKEGGQGKVSAAVHLKQVLQEAKEVLDSLDELRPPAPPVESTASSGQAITLEQMRQNHDIEMAKLSASSVESERRWQLELKKFEDQSKREWQKYADDKERSQRGMAGLMDMADALVAGRIQSDMAAAGQGTVTRNADEPAAAHAARETSQEANFQVHVEEFPCQTCGTKIKVSAPGKVECPDCGTVYGVKEAA